MTENSYLRWLSQTDSFWWTDSAVYKNMDDYIGNGATGATTNPPLVRRSLYGDPNFWRPYLKDIDPNLKSDEKAEEIIKRITAAIAEKFLPVFKSSKGKQGYVCAQVNPALQGNAEKMFEMAKRLNKWAENIAVKIPANAAGLEVMEECASLGITTVGTVSFSVPQAVEIARRQSIGAARAEKAGIKPGQAFSVVMVGRQDDYIRDIAMDNHGNLAESDIIQAGTAVIKRAHEIVKSQSYISQLMPAGMRGAYHTIDLAGTDMTMSISANIQDFLAKEKSPFKTNIDKSIPKDVIDRLCKIPEFVRAYEPDGMKASEFLSYGLCQRTLSQFSEAWLSIQEFVL
ncbi:MAG: transaldolase family protein [Treponema sp.]|jgi:transaldolase|nr:transaldolase family protein [Treponema sp.]